MAEKNPWDKDYVAPKMGVPTPTPTKTQELNPWDDSYTAPEPIVEPTLPEDPEVGMDFQGYTNALDNPEQLQKNIDANNDLRTKAGAITSNEDDLLASSEEIYAPVRNNPKYADLNEYENSLLYSAGQVPTPWGEYSLRGETPPELVEMKKQRDQEMQAAYLKTGKEEVNMPGHPIRVQETLTNNPSYDPNQPESPDNQTMTKTRYLVSPPDETALKRITYNVAKNIVGGIGDLVVGATKGELNLTQDGAVSKALPGKVPNSDAEAFATELTTFVIGPKVVETVGKGAIAGARATQAGTLVSKAASMLSPEAVTAVKTVYTSTLAKTKDAAKAMNAANSLTKRMLVGSAIFMGKATALGTAEAIVAPQNSEGLVDPKTISQALNVSDAAARDISFVLDSPMIGATLSTMGKAYNLIAEKVVRPTIGGIRQLNVLGIDGNKLVNGMGNGMTDPLIEKAAGLQVLAWLDPGLLGAAPEDFAFRVKVLGDSLQRNAVKNLQIGSVGKAVEMDSAAAFSGVARDYYRIAYAELQDSMSPKEFNDFVADRADVTANRFLELRTNVLSDPEIQTKDSRGAKGIENLLDEGAAGQTTSGSVIGTQDAAGNLIADTKISRDTQIEDQFNTAKNDALVDRAKADTAMTDNPDLKKLVDEADAEGLGADGEYVVKRLDGMSEKVYQGLKTMKTDYEAAYKAVGDAGAIADTGSLLKIVKDSGSEDPVIRRIAESINSDDSFKHIYNEVRTTIGKEIGLAQKAGNSERLSVLIQLKNNINNDQMDWLKSNGDGDVAQLADKAKQSYVNFLTTYKNDEAIKRVTKAGEARYRGETMPTGLGPGQGVTDYRVASNRFISENLDGPQGKDFRESLLRASKAGGQPIDKEIGEYYGAQAVSNLANKLASGGKQNVSSLRQSIGEFKNTLKDTNPQMFEKLKSIETDIQALESKAVNSEETYKKIAEKTQELRRLSQESVLSKFVYKGKEAKGNVGGILKKIYKDDASVNQVNELYDEALNLPEGKVIKEAIKSTYIDHFKDHHQRSYP